MEKLAEQESCYWLLRACPNYFFWISTYELMKY